MDMHVLPALPSVLSSDGSLAAGDLSALTPVPAIGPTLDIPLMVAGVVGVLVFPGLVFCYRLFVLPRRVDDMEASIWCPESLQVYADLFTKGDRPASNPADVVRREFMAVHSARQYHIHGAALTLVVSAVVWVLISWAHSRIAAADSMIGKLDSAAILALAGAYCWSVYELLGRVRCRDLTPDDLVELLLRHLSAIPIGYAFSLLAIESVAGTMAFASTAFPLRDVRLLVRQRALKKFEAAAAATTRAAEGHLATTIDGLSDATVARLEEIQITTYLDLAYANPVRVMARTGFSLRHIIAWIDQALLCVYAPQAKTKLASAGIPCALDAVEFYREHFLVKDKTDDQKARSNAAIAALAKATNVDAPLLGEMFDRVARDPHVRFLSTTWYSEDCATTKTDGATPAATRS